uniref:Adenosylcobinamide-GDP ribazoletransferase n=1 Tax=Candidatus Methanophagaceae archaeon ANME-1 ERB6 TaxID=2759912 RepID=A0A7G9YW26_9EURY|nr:adenosylcobinamide-GDP ribazoletransferase [Methanosarcinales archaeon ANME-1 ERB6]
MLDLISFLTQIPVRKAVRIEEVAVRTYLFPLVALLIGLVIAAVAFVVFECSGSAPEIAALLVLLAIYLVTGLMHLDGLADFFDGVMAGGTKEDKRRAMKDEKIGIAGLFATVFVILLSFFAIETVCTSLTKTAPAHSFDLRSFYHFASVFVIAEVSAKMSMNTCMISWKSKEGAGGGMGALFIHSFSKSGYVVALISSILISLIFTAFSLRFFIVFTGIAVAIVVSCVAKSKFGAVSGDAIGASNELARCATLLVWAISQAAF